MHLLWRRYARSGYAPAWFYAASAAGFVALAAWALARGDWAVAAIAAAMAPVAIAGGRLMRRLRQAAEASQRRVDAEREAHDG